MPSSSSKWPPSALTKGAAGWSTQTPVANTQLEDSERHHASPHLAEDIKQSPLLTGMCLVSAWKPEGINSICWISVLYQPGNYRGAITSILANSFEMRKSKIQKSLDQKCLIVPCIRMTSGNKRLYTAYLITFLPPPHCTYGIYLYGSGEMPSLKQNETTHRTFSGSLAEKDGPMMQTNEM